uniref:Uncharacterized protein n=1 Tax=Aureoumbra lagunensis TaxID=44058 RepID=A0A7S3JZY8_9STRA|mmetsp:Transcript_9423/g.13055  ORF Transcript_9423/g.13055 Transcript_9423/m.13055 type:complete len:213 (+) Transcript_9423:95-733(+)
MQENEEIIYAVLSWLDDSIQQHDSKSKEEVPQVEPPGIGQREALVVASSCISSYYGVHLEDTSQKRDLVTIYKAGLRTLAIGDDLNEHFSMAKTRVSGNVKFVELYEAAEEKGYFDGCTEIEYKQKFVKLANKLTLENTQESTGSIPPSSREDQVRHAVAVVASCFHDHTVADLAANLLVQDPLVLERLMDDPRARPAARRALANFRSASST